jgi:hypothetical protein
MRQVRSATPFPLTWPIGVPRTPARERGSAKFTGRNWSQALAELRIEIRRLGGDALIVSTNQPIRNDGMPYAQERRIDDPGVAVYFTLDSMPVCLPCDRWATIAENLRAIVLHIEALRGQQRWGVGTAKQAFAGYAALPASTEENWWDVFGLVRDMTTVDDIQAKYKLLALAAHPDRGGTQELMSRLNTARDRAIAEVKQ